MNAFSQRQRIGGLLLLFFSLLGFMLTAGCDAPNNNNEISDETWYLPVDSVKSISIQSDAVVCTLAVTLNNTCWYVDHYNVEKDRNTYTVSTFYGQNGSYCIQVTDGVYPSIIFDRPAPGDYLLRFMSHDSTTLDTTITIAAERKPEPR